MRSARGGRVQEVIQRYGLMSPSNTLLSVEGSRPHLIDGYFGSRLSIGSAVFAQLTRVPNTQTNIHKDHAKNDVCSNNPHLARVLAMWPKNFRSVVVTAVRMMVVVMVGRLQRQRRGSATVWGPCANLPHIFLLIRPTISITD